MRCRFLSILFCSIFLQSLLFASVSTDVYKEVFQFKPVGYWPVDEGKGKVLYDRSGGKNHGRIYSVPWRDGFLDFENDVYQWVEVPYKKEFGSKNFSMGGWLYSGYDKCKDQESRIGAILIGQPFIDATPKGKIKWGAIWGDRIDSSGAILRYGIGAKKNVTFLEVASGKQADVVGTVKTETVVAHSKWQHLFYTYDGSSGMGSAYLNGNLVKIADNIPFEPMKTPLVIGGGRWGTFNLGGNASLHGTVRHIAFFDRVLGKEEVEKLAYLTRPEANPKITLYSKRKAKPEKAEIPYNLTELIERVQNKQLDEILRGKAAMQLASMGLKAKTAIPALVAELQQMIDADGIYLLKVEEYFRNAIIQALLSIDRKDAEAQKILGEALVKPFFEKIDTSKAYFDDIRPMIKSEQWFDALKAYQDHMKSLPKVKKHNKWGSYDNIGQIDEVSKIFPLSAEYFDGYFCTHIPYADAGYSAYNIVDNTPDGYSYATMYERVPYDEVQNQFDEHLKSKTDNRPDLEHKEVAGSKRTWTRKWSRVKIVQLTPEGKRKMAYLEGLWFIYDAEDAKNDGWSIITDEKGYIHVWGGQHNQPNAEFYLPGIWPQLGMAEGEKAGVLYWVSKIPHDITEFEFVGHSKNPRGISGWLNYMNLVRSRSGQIFIYCRGNMWTWALHRYDSTKQRWTMIKGSARNMLKKYNPQWSANLGRTVTYYGPSDGLVEAFQPGAYNFCRTWPHLTGNVVRGITFDLSGRMHLCLPILGVGQNSRMTHGPVYAYSDDLGDTFYGADGKRLKLPLTVNPIPGHYADRAVEPAKSHFDLWGALVREFDSK